MIHIIFHSLHSHTLTFKGGFDFSIETALQFVDRLSKRLFYILSYLFLFSKRHFYYIEENVLSSQPGIRIYLMNHCRPNPLSWQMCLLWKFRPSPQNLTPHNLDFLISLLSIMNTKHVILVFNPELLKHQKKTLQELQNCSHWAKGFVERKDSLQWKKISLLSSISLHCCLCSMHFCTVWIVWCNLCIVGTFCMHVSGLPVLSSLFALCVLSIWIVNCLISPRSDSVR